MIRCSRFLVAAVLGVVITLWSQIGRQARRPGVIGVDANAVGQTATVTYDPAATTVEDLAGWVPRPRRARFHRRCARSETAA